MKKIGVFGGSFDPIHMGHLLLAEQCLEVARLDQVQFVPADVPPHKQNVSLTRAENRVDMLRLAIGGNENFQIETCELNRGGVSFTVDTLRDLKKRFEPVELFLLIGGDSLDEFHTWKDPQEICKLATPLVVARPGADSVDLAKLEEFADSEQMTKIKQYSFQSRLFEISSTEIRERIESHKSIRYLLPKAVEQYIYEKKLYAEKKMPAK